MNFLSAIFLVILAGLGLIQIGWSARHWRAVKSSSGADKRHHIEDAIGMSIGGLLLIAIGIALLVYT